ncbi:hypothetical protein GCM10009554_43680 [Kribbella koreensis]|uniref:ApeA N-terminal domain-containing protein n=1 Tax=Kribbella koreensis TaxID=57909 RepID=A0ABN1QUV6_9ACTN
MHAVGFPISPKGSNHPYVGPENDEVPTAGGSWSGGTMTRDGDAGWRWKPHLAFDANSASDAEIAFGSRQPLDLRLRLIAHIPLAGDDLRITAAGRRRLTAALSESGGHDLLSSLACGRVDAPIEPEWCLMDDQYGRNDSWGASYEASVSGSNGDPALRSSLKFLMPQHTFSTIVAIVDLEIDFDGCQPQPCPSDTPAHSRLSLSEVVEFFTTAWAIAFDILPLALHDGLADVELAGRPRVGLHLISERPPNSGGDRTFRLTDLVDLSPFGTTNKQRLSQLSIAVLGRGQLSEPDARVVLRQALSRLAEDSGFDRPDLVQW